MAGARHGSFSRAQSGCDCTPCSRTADRVRNTVVAQRTVARSKTLKLGQAQVITITGANDMTAYHLTDGTEGVYRDLMPEQVLGFSGRSGDGSLNIMLVMNKPLYDAALQEDEILNTLQALSSELAGMPKSVLRNAIDVSAKVDGGPKYDRHMIRRQDLPEIAQNIDNLMAMLLSGEDPAKIAARYPMIRDQIRQRREEFVTVDGKFEVLQRLMAQKLDV